MTLREARGILTEMQKWRRSEPPYDGDPPSTHRECPYTPREFGQAIDTGIEAINLILDGHGTRV